MRLIAVALLVAGFVMAKALQAGHYIPFFSEMVSTHEREHERHLPGMPAFHYMLGFAVVLFLFSDKTVIFASLLCLAFGDSASTFFGIKFGKTRIAGKKTLEGTVGGIIACFLILTVFFNWFTAFVTALASMLSELLPLNDSYTIPITAAVCLTLIL